MWHFGVGAALTYVTLGRRRIDYRYVLLGAILPDALDGALSVVLTYEGAGRGVAHSLLAVVVVAVAIMLAFSGTTRVAVFGVAVGWLTHIVADGMWQAPETFLWPAFGTGFAATPAEPYSWAVLLNPLGHLSTWGGELFGAAVLAWFAIAFGLGDSARLRLFLRDGYLRP